MTMKGFLAVLVWLALAGRAGAQATNISTSGTLPTNCTVGNVYVKTGTGAGFYVCLATDTWTQMSTGGGSALSGITAATTSNTIASGNNGAQIWNWARTSTGDTMTFGETTAATSGNSTGNQSIVKAATLASSTAVPFVIDNFGAAYSLLVNDVAADTTPFIVDDAGQVGIHGSVVNGIDLTVHRVGGTGIRLMDGTVQLDFTTDFDSLCKGCIGTTTNHSYGFVVNNTLAGYFATNRSLILQKPPSTTLTNASAGQLIFGAGDSTNGQYRAVCAGYAGSATYSPICFGYVQTNNSGNTAGDFFVATRVLTTDSTPLERMRVKADGTVSIEDLKTTGAATGKKVVCVDTSTGVLYASSTGTDCSN